MALQLEYESVELRPYQQDDYEAIIAQWNSGLLRIMYQAPTGSGKTVLGAYVVREHFRRYPLARVVWMTHTEELNDQSANLLRIITGRRVLNGHARTWRTSMKGQWPTIRGENVEIIVASALVIERRLMGLENFDLFFRPTDLLITDEAHHSVADTWERVIQAFPGFVLGMTATPWRLEKGIGFDHIYDELICSLSTRQLIEQGYLSYVTWDTPGIDAEMKTMGAKLSPGGDYLESELARLNPKAVRTDKAIDYWERQAIDDRGIRKTIVYAIASEHAYELYHEFTRRGFRAGLLLSDREGTISVKEARTLRSSTVQNFRDGKLDVIINVRILTEGFDCPDADCVMILRSTKSVALYLQMAGRGMRVSEKYDDSLICDMTGSWRDKAVGTFLDEREWSLEPRPKNDEGDAPYKECDECGEPNHAAAHNCTSCGFAFGRICGGCRWQPNKAFSAYTTYLSLIKGGERCALCQAGVNLSLMYRLGHTDNLSDDLYYLQVDKGNDSFAARWTIPGYIKPVHSAIFLKAVGQWQSMDDDETWRFANTVIEDPIEQSLLQELQGVGALELLKEWGFLTEEQKAIIEIEGVAQLGAQNNGHNAGAGGTLSYPQYQRGWNFSPRGNSVWLRSVPQWGGIKVWAKEESDGLVRWGAYTATEEHKPITDAVNSANTAHDDLQGVIRESWDLISPFAVQGYF